MQRFAKITVAGSLLLSACLVLAQDAAPKYTIEEVMVAAHKPSANHLLRRVAKGEASDAEKAKLLELYQALAASDWGADWAIEVYQRARPGYHPMTRQAAEQAPQPSQSTSVTLMM